MFYQHDIHPLFILPVLHTGPFCLTFTPVCINLNHFIPYAMAYTDLIYILSAELIHEKHW